MELLFINMHVFVIYSHFLFPTFFQTNTITKRLHIPIVKITTSTSTNHVNTVIREEQSEYVD